MGLNLALEASNNSQIVFSLKGWVEKMDREQEVLPSLEPKQQGCRWRRRLRCPTRTRAQTAAATSPMTGCGAKHSTGLAPTATGDDAPEQVP